MTYPDLARLAVSAELGHDGRSTEVGRHAEVRETGRGEDDDRELVEEPGAARALQCANRPRMSVLHPSQYTDAYQEVKDHRAQEGERDERERGPQPVGAVGADVEVSIGWVEVQRVVRHRYCLVVTVGRRRRRGAVGEWNSEELLGCEMGE